MSLPTKPKKKMKAYKITATSEDNNGVRVDASTPETLGDAHGRLFASAEAADAAADALRSDISMVNETTEYEVEEEEIDLTEIDFRTTRPDYPSHMIDDAGMIYWVVAPGATNDAIADAFRAGYDGSAEPFEVTELASDERAEYTA